MLAVSLAPRDRQATAISWVAGGFALATVAGGPLGALVGEHLGWRATFWAVVAAAVASAVAIVLLVPARPAVRAGASAGARGEPRALWRPQVRWAFTVTTVSRTGWFLRYAYVTPLLREATGLGRGAAAAMLFVFGAGGFLGDRAPPRHHRPRPHHARRRPGDHRLRRPPPRPGPRRRPRHRPRLRRPRPPRSSPGPSPPPAAAPPSPSPPTPPPSTSATPSAPGPVHDCSPPAPRSPRWRGRARRWCWRRWGVRGWRGGGPVGPRRRRQDVPVPIR
ncbi:MFS transporter [Streptantibioticus cattleyicolor]|uniref:MFS transporter n=1 Tax=Streptantibioticus cattleyicolor TaxID=29303 RepID=UPI003899B8C1